MFNSTSLQPAFDCLISILNTIQKIFIKLQTEIQNQERNDRKIVIIFWGGFWKFLCQGANELT